MGQPKPNDGRADSAARRRDGDAARMVGTFSAFVLLLLGTTSVVLFVLSTGQAGDAVEPALAIVAACLTIAFVACVFLVVVYVVPAVRAGGNSPKQSASAHGALGALRPGSASLAALSHEIRTPMTGIIGVTELLGQTELSPTQARYAQTIQSSAHALLALVNDLLDLAKIEAGKLDLRDAPTDLRRMTEDIASLLGATIRDKGVELVVSVGKDVPARVLSDGDRLRQVLTNLVGNAVKFTDRGKIVVSVGRLSADGSVLLFEVSDTGIGISKEDQARLFEPFARIAGAAGARPAGTGLGLAISRELVRAMGGELVVSSEAGKGSTFSFTVPMREASEPLARPAPASRPVDPPTRNGVTEILVAEDDATTGEVLGQMLESLGARPTLVKDGEAALAALTKQAYSLLLVDCEMPRKDGYETAELVRSRETGGTRIPIIAVTAHASATSREKALRAGADDHLTKPVTLAALAAMLERFVPGSTSEAKTRTPLPPEAAEDSPLDPAVKRSRRVATVFLDHAPGQVDDVARAVDAGDSAAVKAAAHKLRGGSAGVGVRKMAALCAALEAFPENSKTLVTELRAELARATAAIESELRELA